MVGLHFPKRNLERVNSIQDESQTQKESATGTSFAVFEKVFPGIAVQIIVLGSNWRNAPGLTTGEQRLNSCQFFVGDQHQLSPAGLHSALRQAELAPCTFFGTLHLREKTHKC